MIYISVMRCGIFEYRNVYFLLRGSIYHSKNRESLRVIPCKLPISLFSLPRTLKTHTALEYASKDKSSMLPETKFNETHEKKLNKENADSSPNIMVIDTNDKMHVMTQKQADKMAKRKNFKLVESDDSLTKTTNYKAFRLVTNQEYYEESAAPSMKLKTKKPPFKGEKHLILSSKISPHDLASKLRKIEKWVAHNFEVRVSVDFANLEVAKEIMKTITEDCQKYNGVVKQLTEKTRSLKFTIRPSEENK